MQSLDFLPAHSASQNNKKEFVEESKARNKTLYRKGAKPSQASLGKDKRPYQRTNLPKLKSISKQSQDSEGSGYKKPPRRKPNPKYAHVRSSVAGYIDGEAPSYSSKSRVLPPLKSKRTERISRRAK